MKILLVNPPNCGRSIPEERYGIDSLRQILRGEPLCLEVLAGNLPDHEVAIVDLKVEPEGLEPALTALGPDLVGFTAMTCEANTVLRLARQAKQHGPAPLVVVGGSHASCDPGFFNQPEVDFVCTGLGARTFAELVAWLELGRNGPPQIPGMAATAPGTPLHDPSRPCDASDLVDHQPVRYDLVARYRQAYTLARFDLPLGAVVSAYGCPHRCTFCSIAGQTGGRYLTRRVESVVRDVGALGEASAIRLVDANTFGDPAHARRLCRALAAAGLHRPYVVDVRADTVVREPRLLEEWKAIGLRAAVIGFEAIADEPLGTLRKGSPASANGEAIEILRGLGISIVGDFIVSPAYTEEDFTALRRYLERHPVDLPMFTILTPLPGTPLHRELCGQITLHDLDYYTLTNAVTATRLPEARFYAEFAALVQDCHRSARL